MASWIWSSLSKSHEDIEPEDLLEHQPKLIALITGLCLNADHKLFLPMDIIYTIIKYIAHLLDINMHIIGIHYRDAASDYQHISVHHISLNSHQVYPIKPIQPIQSHSPPLPRLFPNCHPKVTPNQHCFIPNKSLPYHCYQQLCNIESSNLHSFSDLNINIVDGKKTIPNQNWTFVANIGGTINQNHYIKGDTSILSYFTSTQSDGHYVLDEPVNTCSLTAIHPFLDKTAISIPLPNIPTKFTNPNVIYSQIHNKLYIMNHQQAMHGKTIYALDMSSRSRSGTNTNSDWKWKWDWQLVSDKLKFKRKNTSLCMVDGDRYIAILGGEMHDYEYCNHAELYSLQTDTSIALANMIGRAANGSSIYHPKLHKIICFGRGNHWEHNCIEIYDINKDKWERVGSSWEKKIGDSHFTLWSRKIKQRQALQMIHISPSNPNILFCLADDKALLTHITRFDLRTNAVVEDEWDLSHLSRLPMWESYVYANFY